MAEAMAERDLMGLVRIRAFQITGCLTCVDAQTRVSPELDETQPRRYLLAAWRGVDLFNRRERAALALTEAIMGSPDARDLTIATYRALEVLGAEPQAVIVHTISRIKLLPPPRCHERPISTSHFRR
ncbi:carboxymuconolactone decarboxylase family protein [Kribbella sp. NPDC050459]|uniref:carboxymuconolactone decarboxylase family protein n=1 Tax=Kribbella sp. NPDC050459 TaxID=3155785 RepID=UPI003406E92E